MTLFLIEDTGKRFVFSPKGMETIEIVVFASDLPKAKGKILQMFNDADFGVHFEMGE